jgi:hypothetical protein
LSLYRLEDSQQLEQVPDRENTGEGKGPGRCLFYMLNPAERERKGGDDTVVNECEDLWRIDAEISQVNGES